MMEYKTVNCYMPRQILKFKLYDDGTVFQASPRHAQLFTLVTQRELDALPSTVSIVLSRIVQTFPEDWTDCLVNRQAGLLGTVSSTLLVRIHGKAHVCIQGIDKPIAIDAEWDELEHQFFEGTNLKTV